MNSPGPAVTRRALLGMAVLASLAACTRANPPVPSPPPPPPSTTRQFHDRLMELEKKYDARLGVYALDTGDGGTVEHRADERFAFCSTFKGVAAAAVLQRNPLSHLETRVRYSRADLMKHAPVTERHVATGMTIRQLCDAAVRFSDGTAGNLLLRDLGGPAALTAFTRGLGDTVTRMDRIEPAITEATPGDLRDTTTPRAFAADYREIVLGDTLAADKRDFLRDLLQRTVTGAGRIRAGLPPGWTVAGKTGTGEYGTLNDIAVLWPPGKAPIVLAVMSSKAAKDAPYDEALLAEAAKYVVEKLA
ncbi:class A beta-lactamase [Amycolatopsis keratiniphila]|uniref:class A beta-lactamase n=1 Tax=Amycolatopsis keratiniphila TaxID=129921 RepID=UPI00087CD0CE|nr:class A beta-lactamase [Amycolatopsis keratiniphila]OLZ53887.1 class A beta-lactamase [Amycolatopsis keratiniphila subsp. nogabecina]SDU33371.1 beta-lactamase class A [Amycolatopsis keratiniphila]